MRFHLLGPVEAWNEGRPLNAGAKRQERTLLAALLVDAGRLVPASTLVERVWGAHAPGDVRPLLHAQVSRIGRGLGRSVILSCHGGGYRFDVAGGDVDVQTFRRLVREARRATGYERLALLDSALGLWRGEQALAGLPSEWAESTRHGYHLERLEATLLWSGTLLALGHAHEAVDTLWELAVRNPLVEPVTAALMRALHTVGYTAEALLCFHETRLRRLERIGTEPGRELQELYEALANGKEPWPRP